MWQMKNKTKAAVGKYFIKIFFKNILQKYFIVSNRCNKGILPIVNPDMM